MGVRWLAGEQTKRSGSGGIKDSSKHLIHLNVTSIMSSMLVIYLCNWRRKAR